MGAAFLLNDLSGWGAPAATTSATAAGLGADRLRDRQPRRRVRLLGNPAVLCMDFGTARPMDCFALVSTTIAAGTALRLDLHNAAGDVTAPGNLRAWQEAGETGPANMGQVVRILPAPLNVRYVKWVINSPSGELDIGLAPCGLLLRTRHQFDWSQQRGRQDYASAARNPDTGARFPVGGPAARAERISFPFLTAEETEALDAWDRAGGAAGEALWVPETAWAPDRLARYAIWGELREPGFAAATRRTSRFWTRPFTVLEAL